MANAKTPKAKSAKTPTVRAVSSTPQVTLSKEPLVEIIIDRDMTSGGIRINGKLYVGRVKVTKDQADDLLRIQEEYAETMKKIFNPNISVRMKNDFQKEALFLADPAENEGKKGYTRDYGLLPLREWSFCSDVFKEHLLELRMQYYGY
jgi:hypothetical protein